MFGALVPILSTALGLIVSSTPTPPRPTWQSHVRGRVMGAEIRGPWTVIMVYDQVTALVNQEWTRALGPPTTAPNGGRPWTERDVVMAWRDAPRNCERANGRCNALDWPMRPRGSWVPFTPIVFYRWPANAGMLWASQQGQLERWDWYRSGWVPVRHPERISIES